MTAAATAAAGAALASYADPHLNIFASYAPNRLLETNVTLALAKLLLYGGASFRRAFCREFLGVPGAAARGDLEVALQRAGGARRDPKVATVILRPREGAPIAGADVSEAAEPPAVAAGAERTDIALLEPEGRGGVVLEVKLAPAAARGGARGKAKEPPARDFDELVEWLRDYHPHADVTRFLRDSFVALADDLGLVGAFCGFRERHLRTSEGAFVHYGLTRSKLLGFARTVAEAAREKLGEPRPVSGGRSSVAVELRPEPPLAIGRLVLGLHAEAGGRDGGGLALRARLAVPSAAPGFAELVARLGEAKRRAALETELDDLPTGARIVLESHELHGQTPLAEKVDAAWTRDRSSWVGPHGKRAKSSDVLDQVRERGEAHGKKEGDTPARWFALAIEMPALGPDAILGDEKALAREAAKALKALERLGRTATK